MNRLSAFAIAVVCLGACGAQGPRDVLLAPAPEIPAPDSFDVVFETGQDGFTVRAIRALREIKKRTTSETI